MLEESSKDLNFLLDVREAISYSRGMSNVSHAEVTEQRNTIPSYGTARRVKARLLVKRYLPESNEPIQEDIFAHMEEDGTAWAYLLAEGIVLHARYLGLLNGMILPMDFALVWYEPILRWHADVVAEVSAWRTDVRPIGKAGPVPAVVSSLIEQAKRSILSN